MRAPSWTGSKPWFQPFSYQTNTVDNPQFTEIILCHVWYIVCVCARSIGLACRKNVGVHHVSVPLSGLINSCPRLVYNHCQKMPADLISSLQNPTKLMSIDADAWKFELEFGRSQGIAETHIGGWCFEMLSRVFNLIPNDEFICQMG